VKRLFGISLGNLVNEKLGPHVGKVTLTKVTNGALKAGGASGKEQTETPYVCNGYKVDDTSKTAEKTSVHYRDTEVRIYMSSLPAGVVPTRNDKVTVGGVVYRIERVGGLVDTVVSLFVQGPGVS
jgi:hypothetical protein